MPGSRGDELIESLSGHTTLLADRQIVSRAWYRRVRNFGYTGNVDDSQSQLSARDARAHFAEVVNRAQDGTPTIVTRNGQPVAAVVPIQDFNALEDAIDRYFAREADRDLAENPDARTYSMSEVVAAIFEEDAGQSGTA